MPIPPSLALVLQQRGQLALGECQLHQPLGVARLGVVHGQLLGGAEAPARAHALEVLALVPVVHVAG